MSWGDCRVLARRVRNESRFTYWRLSRKMFSVWLSRSFV